MTDTAETTDVTRRLSLHDCLALGQLEQGLSEEPIPSLEELHRLPTLLRLLSSTRSLASIPTFSGEILSDRPDGDDLPDAEDDASLDEVVRRLEDRAAIYSVAEGVEVVSCHLAPAACRKISRIKSMRKKSGVYDTETLWDAASSGASELFRKQTKRWEGVQPLHDLDRADGMSTDEDDCSPETNTGSQPVDAPIDSSVLRSLQQSEDSQEANISRTLSELASLVVESLKPPRIEHEEGSRTVVIDWSISMEDSILSEARQSKAALDNVGGAMIESDLGANIVSLMYHCPVLRHDHVASALCRATLPQAADIIARMGANSSVSVPTLVRGCIQAYENSSQSKSKNHAIAAVTRDAVKALADLSDREKARVRNMLAQEKVMIDVQLELAFSQDPMTSCCILIEELELLGVCQEHAISITDEEIGREVTQRPRATTISPEDHIFIKMRTLCGHLHENVDLLILTLEFLKNELHKENRGLASYALLLRACSWLFSRIPMSKAYAVARGRRAFTGLLASLKCVVEFMKRKVRIEPSELIEESPLDGPFGLLMCLLVLFCTSLCSIPGEEHNLAFREVLESAFELRKVSMASDALAAKLVCVLTNGKSDSLCQMVGSILRSRRRSSTPVAPLLVPLTSKAIEWMNHSSLLRSSISVLSEGCRLIQNLSFMNEFVVADRVCQTDRYRTSKQALEYLFELKNSIVALQDPQTPSFVASAITLLCQEYLVKIPIIMPTELEILASRVSFSNPLRFDAHMAYFLLCLLYCMEFLCQEPDSAFKINPRILPLKESYIICTHAAPDQINQSFSTRMLDLIERHCPDVPFRARSCLLLKLSRHVVSTVSFSEVPGGKRKNMLVSLLRRSLLVDTNDSADFSSESVFLQAARDLSDCDLVSAATSALTSNRATSNLSFTSLYRDPIILLKCPLKVIQREDLCRIIMYLLSILLEANWIVCASKGADRDTNLEYITSLNAILLRCFLSSLMRNPKLITTCGMLVGFIRAMAATGSGSVALLMKQQVKCEELDWLVEFIPEVMEDWEFLSATLSDRSSLSSVERLNVADGALRIAVVHGYKYESEAHALAYAALACMIASFFLIIGPVGVPVNTGEGCGVDATKAARIAAFRIINTVKGVRAYRPKLRNEFGLFLQKLSALCKGDNILSGLPNSVASQQKLLLKDMIEAIHGAADALNYPGL